MLQGLEACVRALAEVVVRVGLNLLPGQPLLLAYAFVFSQVFGQLMVGAAPLLKQYFLPAALTFAFIFSVPSSGGTVTPDLLPGPVPLPGRRAATGAGRERHPQRGLLPRRRYHATDTSDAVVGGHRRRHGSHRLATTAAPAATSVDRGQRAPAARAFAHRTTPGPGLVTSG